MTPRRFNIGFRASVIALFVGVVLFVGQALVYLSLGRVSAITRSAASSFLDTVAQLSSGRAFLFEDAGRVLAHPEMSKRLQAWDAEACWVNVDACRSRPQVSEAPRCQPLRPGVAVVQYAPDEA